MTVISIEYTQKACTLALFMCVYALSVILKYNSHKLPLPSNYLILMFKLKVMLIFAQNVFAYR